MHYLVILIASVVNQRTLIILSAVKLDLSSGVFSADYIIWITLFFLFFRHSSMFFVLRVPFIKEICVENLPLCFCFFNFFFFFFLCSSWGIIKIIIVSKFTER